MIVMTLALAALFSHLTQGSYAHGWFGLDIMAIHSAALFALLGASSIAIGWRPGVISWSLNRNTTVAFACGLALLAVIGINTRLSQSWMHDASDKIARIEKMLGSSESLHAELIDAHVHIRDYLATGDEQFIILYQAAKAESTKKLDELRRTESSLDEPMHLLHSKLAEAQIEEQCREMQRMIDGHRSADAGRSDIITRADELLNKLRETFYRIESDDRQTIRKLEMELESVSRFSFLIIFIGTIASLLIFLTAIFRLNHSENERIRKNMALRESEERFRLSFENTGVGMALANPNFNLIEFNDAFHRMLGYSRQELLGMTFEDFTHPDDLQTSKELLEKVLAGETSSFEIEKRYLHKDGHTIWGRLHVSLVRDAQGKPVNFFAQLFDITDRKQAEQKLRDSLAEKEIMMREIHHRVKNNLQTISALLELQSGYIEDEQARGYFRDSQQRIQSMAMIHAQLYQNMNVAMIDFASYLKILVGKLRMQYGERCMQVNIQVNADACTLPVDTAIPCGLVVNELVSNAMKHAFPDRRIGNLLVNLHCGIDGIIMIEVADDGVGLPQGLDIKNSRSFGLRLISMLVNDQLHGRLTIESGVDRGTMIKLETGGRK